MLRKLLTSLATVIAALLDIVAALLGSYYSVKYRAVSKWLGLPQVPAGDERGFIVIQIDGLSLSHLQAAIKSGYAPYLEKLLQRGDGRLQGWRPGFPSTTPASQAGIMFGRNDGMPAFRWYDKLSGEGIVCKMPTAIAQIQARISKDRPGLLTGGSSYMNMFDGDASLSMFTLGAMNRQRFFESVKGFGFLLLFLLNPFRTLKMLVLALWEWFTDLYQRTRAKLLKRTPRPLEAVFPFLRVVGNVIFREIQTFAVMVDVYRGVPSIYTTYYGYDELAHHFGPSSKIALRALKAIDVRIRQMDLFARKRLSRSYDLFVLSDHGMTPAIPFEEQYGHSLGDLIRERLGGSVAVDESSSDDRRGAVESIYLMDELLAIESNMGVSFRYIPRKLRQLVAARLMRVPDGEATWGHLATSDLVVRNSGPVSHVYFVATTSQMALSDVAARFPNLISDLAAHPGIWLVVGREGSQTLIMSREGIGMVDGAAYRVEGQDPLGRLPNPEATAAQLARVTQFTNAGDLLLLGDYDPGSRRVVCFEQQWACHGGIGGDQEQAFLLAPPHVAWDLSEVQHACEIYPLFVHEYGIGAPLEAAHEAALPLAESLVGENQESIVEQVFDAAPGD